MDAAAAAIPVEKSDLTEKNSKTRWIQTTSEAHPSCCRASKQLGWRVLWMKLKKEKRKFFDPPAPLLLVPYDAFTYSQNFDHGLSWDDPENLARSFSVRFADPSMVLVRKTAVSN